MALIDLKEMLKMAVKDEETGVAFYKALAEVAKTEEMKAKLLHMSVQEQEHADRYKSFLAGLGGDYKPTVQKFDGEYEGYLNALLESRAFTSPEDAAAQARATTDITSALDVAINMERDTLLFYIEMRNLVDNDKQKYIQDIIDEEKNHVYELTELKKTL
jgi:rubrerythrin